MGLTRPQFYQIDTTDTKINDPLLEVNSAAAGANTNDLGIIFKRDTADNLAIIWDRSTQRFVIGTTTVTGNATGDIALTGLVDLEVNSIKMAGFQLPSADGLNEQVMVTNGSGSITWQSIDGGTYPV